MLTKKQKEVFDYIKKYADKKGYAPSLQEITDHFNLASVSTAYHYVKKLEQEGYIKKNTNHPRGIEVQPADFVERVVPKYIEYLSVPLLGAANAGPATTFAEENVEGHVRVPRNLMNRRDGVFALRVEGDSMNKAGINGKTLEDGDFAIIDSEYRNPKNGDYVLSVIDGTANLKKFEHDRKTGSVTLIPESTNPKHKPIYISSEDDFMVNGKIIGVIKK